MPVSAHVQIGRARIPGLTSWRHLYSFLGTPLVDRTEVAQATDRLLEHALRASRMGVLVLPWLGDDGPVAAAILAALQRRGRAPSLHRSFERAVIHRSALADGSGLLISPRHRRDLGRLSRRLAEELDGQLEVSDESDSGAGVDEFLSLEASGWKGEWGTAMGSRPAHAGFFREMCDGFRAAGRLQMLALRTAERVVSYQCNLVSGDAVFRFKIAFDESFAHYRPGLQLEMRMLELFRDEMSQSWADSCASPDSPLFKDLWRDRRPIGSYVLAASRAVGWTIDHGAPRIASLNRS
jgi:CelD/BcsL family acetyltransferase involved in cellulose biosynthesis